MLPFWLMAGSPLTTRAKVTRGSVADLSLPSVSRQLTCSVAETS
jgi:hypothetical protein